MSDLNYITCYISSDELKTRLKSAGHLIDNSRPEYEIWPKILPTPETHIVIGSHHDATLYPPYQENSFIKIAQKNETVVPSRLWHYATSEATTKLLPTREKFVFGPIAWLADQFTFPHTLIVWIEPSGCGWRSSGETNCIEMLSLQCFRNAIRLSHKGIPSYSFAIEAKFDDSSFFDFCLEMGQWDTYGEGFAECVIFDSETRLVYIIHHHDNIRVVAPDRKYLQPVIDQLRAAPHG